AKPCRVILSREARASHPESRSDERIAIHPRLFDLPRGTAILSLASLAQDDAQRLRSLRMTRPALHHNLMSQSASAPSEVVLPAAAHPARTGTRGIDAWTPLVRSSAFVNWTAWVCVAVLLAQQTYLVRIATGLPITWLAAFKTTIGGCLLWAVFTPAI